MVLLPVSSSDDDDDDDDSNDNEEGEDIEHYYNYHMHEFMTAIPMKIKELLRKEGRMFFTHIL